MPRCRNCQKEIDKIKDADICPYCGAKQPIETDYRTMDVTSALSLHEGELYKSKSRAVFCWLCALLGYFGVHEFYIGKKSRGVLSIVVCLLLTAIVGSILVLLFSELPLPICFISPFALIWLFHIGEAIYFSHKDTLTDAEGVFLR
ncbi:MAG: TM2 domain-containing protein [Bacillota bacterium]|nr:TM2 domain-containing protein [Bacillota bacterium]